MRTAVHAPAAAEARTCAHLGSHHHRVHGDLGSAGPGPVAQDADGLVLHIPAVTERAVRHVLAPALAEPGNPRQFVHQPGGDQQAAPADHAAVRQGHGKTVGRIARSGNSLALHNPCAVVLSVPPRPVGPPKRYRTTLVREVPGVPAESTQDADQLVHVGRAET